MWHSWQRTACLWVSVFALLLMLIAFFTPGWLIYTINPTPPSTTISFNLWYYVSCRSETGKSDVCGSNSFAAVTDALKNEAAAFSTITDFYNSMVPSEVEATLGLFAGIVAVFCVFIAFTYWCESWYCCSMRNYMGAAAVAYLISGILVFIPTGEFARANDILDNPITTNIRMGVPYSVILMALGGVLEFIVMLILIWMLCTSSQPHHRRRRRYSDSDYGDYNHQNKYDTPYSKYDDRPRPYSIAEPPRYYEKPPQRYSERSLPPPPGVYEKRSPPDYHHNWAYDDSLPRRDHAFHYDDHMRKYDRPYRGHNPFDRRMRY